MIVLILLLTAVSVRVWAAVLDEVVLLVRRSGP